MATPWIVPRHLAINSTTAVAGKDGFTLASAATAVVEFMAKWSNLCPPTVQFRKIIETRDSYSSSCIGTPPDLKLRYLRLGAPRRPESLLPDPEVAGYLPSLPRPPRYFS